MYTCTVNWFYQGEAVHEAGDGDAVRHEVRVDHALDQEAVHTALKAGQDSWRDNNYINTVIFLVLGLFQFIRTRKEVHSKFFLNLMEDLYFCSPGITTSSPA